MTENKILVFYCLQNWLAEIVHIMLVVYGFYKNLWLRFSNLDNVQYKCVGYTKYLWLQTMPWSSILNTQFL